jgi:hypothetical protein
MGFRFSAENLKPYRARKYGLLARQIFSPRVFRFRRRENSNTSASLQIEAFRFSAENLNAGWRGDLGGVWVLRGREKAARNF